VYTILEAGKQLGELGKKETLVANLSNILLEKDIKEK
jgi:hypothetical protein